MNPLQVTIDITDNRPPENLSSDLYRIKPRYDGRTGDFSVYPATEALCMVNPNGVNGNINVFRLPRVWCDWLRVLNTVNGDDHAWRYIQIPKSGIFNATSDPDWYVNGTDPTYNAVAFDGNVVKRKRVEGSWMYVETIRIDLLGTPTNIDFFNARWMVHEFTTVNINLNLYKAGAGLFVQCPLFSNQEVALPLSKLEVWTPSSPPLP